MKFQEQFELQLNELITKLKNFPEDYYHIYYDTNTNKFEVGDEFDNICEITIKHGDIEKLPNNDEELKNILIKDFKKTKYHLQIISKKLNHTINKEIPDVIEELKQSNNDENIVVIGITYNKELYLTTTNYLDRFSYYPFYYYNDCNTKNNTEEQLPKEILNACINFKNKTSKII